MGDTLERLQTAVAGRYAIEQEVGRGGMAVVYRARDVQHNRNIALKVLRPELAASIGADRFLREIQIEASLQHPHILPLYDSGKADGTLYYTMPYVEGETLRQRLAREKQLPVEDVVKIVTQVGDAISYAHGRGVVHRDLKPENIMFSEGHALVSDFGVARAVSEAGGEQLTDSGVAVGTPAYMSPEQATGAAGVDARSDVYSLGLVVYEMLAGDPPFTGTTPQMVMAKQAAERVPSLEIVRPNLPLELVNVIEKALAKVPADRYQTATEFCEALSQGASGETRAVRPRARRKRPPIVGAALAVVVVAALIVWRLLVAPPGLDPNLVVLYPLEWGGPGQNGNGGATVGPELGENVALFVLAALDGKTSLSWVSGWDLLEDRYRDNPRLLRQEDKSDLARAQGAASYVDGRVDTAGPINAAEQLGLLAAGELVLSLLPTGEFVEVSNLAGRKPQAIQFFVQGERDFNAGRFETAYESYKSAVELDSEFALAAVRGAQAAGWTHEADDARELIDIALANQLELAPKAVEYARGFRAFFRNQGDSAVYYFERAIQLDSAWAPGWMGLGEAYSHLLPSKTPQDSLGQAAFDRVYGLAQSFAPGLFHVIEYAIRARELDRAARLLRDYRRADSIAGRSTSDTLPLRQLELLLRCAEEGSESINWQAEVLADVDHVFQVAKKSSVGGAYPQCAIAAYRAVVEDNPPGAYLFASLAGLQSNLAATGRVSEVKALIDSAARGGTRSGVVLRLYYIVGALAQLDVETEAEQVVDSLRAVLADLPANVSWFVGVWDAYNGRLDEARRIRNKLMALASASEGYPTEADLVDRLDRIERDLEQAVRDEEFEIAAELRDQKREVDSVLKKFGGNAISELDSLAGAKQRAIAAEDFELAAEIQAREREIRVEVRDTLREERVEEHRSASLLANSLEAHVAAAEGDTTGAILLFQALVASGPRSWLGYPWESLGLERLQQARLLLAVGDYEEAYQVATTFDSPGAVNVIYPMFLRQSLEIRLEAMQALGREKVVNELEDRLARLRSEDEA
jgi:tRNA A-37 threonylcarbamoyl transferase component Bud32